MPPTAEQKARETIDAGLAAAGWTVQDRAEIDLSRARGVAVRELRLAAGHGVADYLLFVDGRAVGVLEAKPAGHTLTGVEPQGRRYATGLPRGLRPPVEPLPFVYLSSGEVTRFTNLLDPRPRSRQVFAVHRPETLAGWLDAEPLVTWSRAWAGAVAEGAGPRDASHPSTLRARLQTMPPLARGDLFPNQARAIEGLERSLREDRPRALVQMATGSGKTLMAVAAIYRLIKYGGARRVLFLVDRKNLGEQAEGEFAGYRNPDDHRLFPELYGVQRLTGNTIGDSAQVVITTIQRLYSMLRGEELDDAAEDVSLFDSPTAAPPEPPPVAYDAALPPETFDVVVIDECHRSIYTLWRQVLEYFDAFLIGLTATPAKHTFGFFDGNLVMEYGHEEAVADGVNVDFEVYRIRTRISEQGSTVEAAAGAALGYRDRRTRAVRWQRPDEDLTYAGSDLDRAVVAKDQLRLLAATFKERLFTELFPGRTVVPKTLVFAKDDSHAEDVVEVFRREFAEGEDFCRKITYKTTGADPRDLIQAFRNSFLPRIAVTVDMIATGTDVKAIEIVMFLRMVHSRVLFEQMKGRGVRIIDADELRGVTPDAVAKTHFVVVDAVGVTETELVDTQPLERQPGVSLGALLEHVALRGTDPEILSSLAARLARLDRECDDAERRRVAEASGGLGLGALAGSLVHALDPDRQRERAREKLGLGTHEAPPEEAVAAAYHELAEEAGKPLAGSPPLRQLLVDLRRRHDQVIDEVSQDALLFAGPSGELEARARRLVESFEAYVAENRDEIAALRFFYSIPFRERMRYEDLKRLAEAIQAPPRSWTPRLLWQAYELLDRDRVRGASAQRLLTDVVSLVRFALHQEEELVPYAERVHERFDAWLAGQEQRGPRFNAEQRGWLEMIRDQIATNLEMEVDDFDFVPFAEKGGLGRARQVFGGELGEVLREMNEVLVA